MKFHTKYITFFISILVTICTKGQSFERSGDCQDSKNVHCLASQTSYMNTDNIRAVFQFSTGSGSCTGTMINQFYDAGGILRQYFKTENNK